MTKEVQNPCIKICIFDDDSGYCIGCSRTAEEVEKWSLVTTTNDWKEKNLLELKQREQ